MDFVKFKERLLSKYARLWALIVKEFFSIWRDPKTRFIIFGPPLIQMIIFSNAATLDIVNIKLGVLNNDNSPISREFVRNIEHSPYFEKIIYFNNLKELRSALDEEKVRACIYIPAEFSRKFLAKNNPQIEAMLDGRHTNASQIVLNYISEIASDFTYGKKTVQDVNTPTINVMSRNWYNPNLEYNWFIVTSLVGILSMLMVIMLSSLSLAREKEMGTFDELLVSPLKPGEILLGKLVVPLFFGLFDAMLALIVAVTAFKIPFTGSLPLYFFALFFFLVAIVGVGLFISSICKTQQQAMLGVFVFMFPAMILSGYSAPVENITPQFLQNLTILNPLRFFIVLSKGIILKNMDILNILLNLIPIMIISVLTLCSANWAFKNRLE